MFQDSDFDVFNDETLAGRMAKIKTIIDPKFVEFADIALPILQEDGQEWYAHVAKHLRRTTYAPDNTWVAFAPNRRGYKMLPHFELGMWADHIYFYLAIEENMKPKQTADIVNKMTAATDMVLSLPASYRLSPDHMVNETVPLSDYSHLVKRYQEVKHSEVLIGVVIPRGDQRVGTESLVVALSDALRTLKLIYEQLV